MSKKYFVLNVFGLLLNLLALLPSLQATYMASLKQEINRLCTQSETFLNQAHDKEFVTLKKKNYTTQLMHAHQTRSDEKQMSLFSQQAQKVFLKVVIPLVLQYHLNSDCYKIVYADPHLTPYLHSFVKEYADKLNMPVPMLFISYDETLINAVALSFSHTISAIIIGKSLINGVNTVRGFNQEEFASTILHELTHIKKNHLFKRSIFFCGMTSIYFMIEKCIAQRYIDFSEPEHIWRNRLIYLCMGGIALLGTAQLSLLMPEGNRWVWKPPFWWYMKRGEIEANESDLNITNNKKAQDSSYLIMDLQEEEIERNKRAPMRKNRSFFNKLIALFFEGQYH